MCTLKKLQVYRVSNINSLEFPLNGIDNEYIFLLFATISNKTIPRVFININGENRHRHEVTSIIYFTVYKEYSDPYLTFQSSYMLS